MRWKRFLRSENAHFSLLWEDASGAQNADPSQPLAREPGRPFTGVYRDRHALPPATNVQKALRALKEREVVIKAPAAGTGSWSRFWASG